MLRAIRVAAVGILLAVQAAGAQSLRGSRASVDRQYTIAVQQDYSFLDGTRDVNRFVQLGLLVPVRGGANFEVADVSFPYARPVVRTFVERLSAQYVNACGEALVITSLTRPSSRQPANASDLSVHPAGMAVDLRVSRKAKCRSWLERTLLALEKAGVLEATRERNPAHYHIAVFPRQYQAYVARIDSGTRLAAARGPAARKAETNTVASANSAVAEPDRILTTVNPAPAQREAAGSATLPADPGATAAAAPELRADTIDYRVHRGDTLWSIARKHGTSVQELKEMNGLRSTRIAAGQVIQVPTSQQ